MTKAKAPLAGNRLIDLLPAVDKARLLKVCEPIDLLLSAVLEEPGQPTPYAYFPTDGFFSLVTQSPGCPALEVGMVGREGMLGAQLVLGVSASPLRALVQGSGSALRITAKALQREMKRSAALREVLARYVYLLMSQMRTSATCLRFHQIGPRLARWLLMTQDRAGSDTLQMTHEFLAYMLGVRRVGITNAASAMQADGLIAYSRGTLTVLDRDGLEARACNCYAIDRQNYGEQLSAP